MKIALDIHPLFCLNKKTVFDILIREQIFLYFEKNVLRFTPRYILLPVFTIYLHSTVEQFGIVTAIIELY